VAITKVGTLGIKTWICHGTVYGKRDLFEIAGASQQNQRQQQGNRKGNAPRRNRKNNK
jgi:small subunit ribosomal protein S3